MISNDDIIIKRNEVRQLYSKYGFKSHEYNKSFDELHTLTSLFLAQQWREKHGFSEKMVTPYCLI